MTTTVKTAVKPEYTDVVNEISLHLFQALWEQEPDLYKKVRELDSIVNLLLRRIGWMVVSLLLAELASHVTKKAKARGLTIHRSGLRFLLTKQDTLFEWLVARHD